METKRLSYKSTQRVKLHYFSCFLQPCLSKAIWANIPIQRYPSTQVSPPSCMESSKTGNTGGIAVTMSATCGGSRLVPPRHLPGALDTSRHALCPPRLSHDVALRDHLHTLLRSGSKSPSRHWFFLQPYLNILWNHTTWASGLGRFVRMLRP